MSKEIIEQAAGLGLSKVRGLVKRTSGLTSVAGTEGVYINIEETADHLQGTEATVTFFVPRSASLDAILTVRGDLVYILWLSANEQPDPTGGANKIVTVEKFHLARHVAEVFGKSWAEPWWFAVS